MTPEQWQKIDRVWQAVLARPESERAAAIVDLTAGDEVLRRDVESLLVHLSRANAAGFGAAPLEMRSSQPFLVGRQLGPYTVNALLGVGGMGEVFRAHDATLGRDVAIKILPEPWLTSPDRRARFEREARLLASLNHPNIGAIYGVHESEPAGPGETGVRALVLELVEGETLAERIARQTPGGASRGLAMSDVVPIATQLTAALEAAHDRGIVHRDLKPANIKITPELRVKVLDFGLARAISGTGSEPELPSGQSATASETGAGLLLGTPAYMSPEQARGRPVDKRTDIWAFGCVLYEMLSGVQAFGGADIAESLANVIRAEPDWRRLPADTPRGIRVCLRRSLQKDPDQRTHDIADVRLAMEDAFDAAGGDIEERGRTRWSRWSLAYAGWVVAAVAVVAATAVVIPALRRDPGDRPRVPQANPPVLLSPSAGGGGGAATAKTIQEAIDRVAPGGTVQMLPGTYPETLKITKGLTLQAAGERTGPVVIAPEGTPETVIELATTEPVILRGLTLRVPGLHGIRGDGGVNLSVLRSTLIAVNPPDGTGQLIGVTNDSQVTGVRARVLVQDNSIDGSVTKLPRFEARPRIIGVHLRGDLDGVIERNIVRRTGDVCLHVGIREDLGGETNVEILNNDIDECHPVARVGAILVGSPSVLRLAPDRPITATGVVNIVGNTLRNSSEDCLTAAIMFDLFRGRIERNRIVDFVQPCATQTTRNLPAAIWIGLKGPGIPPVPAVAPRVRFNDIQGNARAGLRLASNQTIAIDASCNYWGSERGPSGIGPGDGDLILVEPGAATPTFLPFAKTPVARQPKPGC